MIHKEGEAFGTPRKSTSCELRISFDYLLLLRAGAQAFVTFVLVVSVAEALSAGILWPPIVHRTMPPTCSPTCGEKLCAWLLNVGLEDIAASYG